MKINFIKIKNDVFRELEKNEKQVFVSSTSDFSSEEKHNVNLLDELHHNKYDINECKFNYISSFNFNRKVFRTGKWSELSKLARGLFINNETGEIVARGYEKFFNYKEYNFNSDSFLMKNLKFPVTAYKKYNGFLGILGFDRYNENNKLLFCSKSQIGGTYSNYFENIFENENHDSENLKKFLDENNLCLMFEVVDVVNDPHIVKYDKSHIVLLDAIRRTESFDHVSYEELKEIGDKFNFSVKELFNVFYDWDSLKSFIDEFSNSDEENIEGYVLSDSNEYKFKLKGKWYKKWKFLRSLKDKIVKGTQFSTSGLLTPEMNYFVSWCKKNDKEYIKNAKIVELRDKFLNEYKGELF